MNYADPNDLRLHPLLKKLPAPDKTSKVWESFVDNLHASGPRHIEPIVITPDNLVMCGGRRWLAAKQLGWTVIPVKESPEDFAGVLITESLFGQRDLTRGAKMYLALDLVPDYLKSAEARRQANLKLNRKTFEKPLAVVKMTSNSYSELTTDVRESLCDALAVSHDTWDRAVAVRKLFAEDPEAKRIYEPQLLSGDKNLWNVISGRAGELGGNKGGRRPVNSPNQLEMFTESLDGLVAAVAPWHRIKSDEHKKILDHWRKAAHKMPPDARKELADILLEVDQTEASAR